MNHVRLDVPNTPEGRAFLKQLRKYMAPQYRMRSRGRHRDRKGLAEQLVRQGVYCEADDKSIQERERIVHFKLRTGMSCRFADRIVTVIDARPGPIQWAQGRNGRWGFWLYPGVPAMEQGPFKTYHAAQAAKRVTEGDAA